MLKIMNYGSGQTVLRIQTQVVLMEIWYWSQIGHVIHRSMTWSWNAIMWERVTKLILDCEDRKLIVTWYCCVGGNITIENTFSGNTIRHQRNKCFTSNQISSEYIKGILILGRINSRVITDVNKWHTTNLTALWKYSSLKIFNRKFLNFGKCKYLLCDHVTDEVQAQM